MAIEKSWAAVPPQLLTTNGNTLGVVNVASAAGFKVKQLVTIANAFPSTQSIQAQIKRVVSPGQFIVGPVPLSLQPPYKQEGASLLSKRLDISAYTVAAGAYVYAAESAKVILSMLDIIQSIYEQEPSCSIRTTSVDQFGNFYTTDNPYPIIFDGTVTVGEVEIKGSPSGDLLNVNADGSINVNVVETPVSGQTEKSIFGVAASVASGIETQIATYTVPIGKTAILHKINTSGENVGTFNIYLNAALFDIQRTYYGGNMNALFDYITGTNSGLVLSAGDIVSVKILHTRVYVANFNARIQILEIG